MTPDSEEYKYCDAMEHLEWQQFYILELIIVSKDQYLIIQTCMSSIEPKGAHSLLSINTII